jgi:hypothetical protein
MCDPLCFLGADTRPWSPLHREEGGTVPSGGVLGQAGQVGRADVVVAVLGRGLGEPARDPLDGLEEQRPVSAMTGSAPSGDFIAVTTASASDSMVSTTPAPAAASAGVAAM